jgi:peptide chain release factor 2
MKTELLADLKILSARLQPLEESFSIHAKLARLQALDARMSASDFWQGPSPQHLIQEQKSLRSITEPYQELQTTLKDETDLVDLADEKIDGDVLAAAVAQLDRHRQKLQALEVLAFFRHKDDPRDAIFTIQSGAGGNDAMDWAEQLERMYLRWFDREGLKYEITDRLEGS